MGTRRLSIREVNKPKLISVVQPTDFLYEPSGEISAEAVFRDPKYTIYCFDPDNDAVLFVESKDPEAVDRHPFYYLGQIENAVGLVSMPIGDYHRIAKAIVEPPKGLIFVHSVGRCGSTLVSKVLSAIPSIHSLSEPDDLTQLCLLRIAERYDDVEIQELLVSSIRWRCKPRLGTPAERVAIKTRSEVMHLADLIGPAFSQSRHCFLYRDGVSWMRSIFKGWPPDKDVYDDEENRKMEISWARSNPMIEEYRRESAPMNAVEIRMLSWMMCMEAYSQLFKLNIPLCAARFEDLTTSPEPTIEQLLSFFEVEVADWSVIREVLGRDSQAGTMYDREMRKQLTRELTDDLVADICNLIATRPALRTPDVVLPGTLCCK